MSRRFPAEWEPCEAVWIAWPHNRDTWPDRFEPVPPAFARLVSIVAESTPVRLLAASPHAEQARRWCGGVPGVTLVDIPTDDCWVRDYGPTFVWDQEAGSESSRLLAVDWRFNAWGGKYFPHDRDAAAGAAIARAAGLPRLSASLTLEGGALETDGAGRLLVNPGCVLDPRRNPDLTREDAAARMNQYLGVNEIVWIDGGAPAGDDTDGHIDQIARFVDRQTVVVAVAGDPADPAASALQINLRQIESWAEQTSPRVTVHRLPTPPPRRIGDAAVPQSYCNFLRLGPDRLLMPTFGEPEADQRACRLLRSLCPGVQVDAVPCEDIAWGLGAVHCATCHQPAAADQKAVEAADGAG